MSLRPSLGGSVEFCSFQPGIGRQVLSLGTLDALGSRAVAEGEPVRSARLFGAAQGIRESTGIALLDLEDSFQYERFLAISRSQLEEGT